MFYTILKMYYIFVFLGFALNLHTNITKNPTNNNFGLKSQKKIRTSRLGQKMGVLIKKISVSRYHTGYFPSTGM